MSYYSLLRCDDCMLAYRIFYSQARVYTIFRQLNSIFIHNGNLISYTRESLHDDYCTICHNRRSECVYIEDEKYYTLSKHSNVTVIECDIKKPLEREEAYIMSNDSGVFISLLPPGRKILFLRGIQLDYTPKDRVCTIYSSHEGLYKSSEVDLQRSIFTIFTDNDKNVYLIDRNGDSLTYEILLFTGEEYYSPDSDLPGSPNDWQIYANDQTRIKVYGGFERVEILTDSSSVGKHTKPALRADNS